MEKLTEAYGSLCNYIEDARRENRSVLIAIDGKSGSGKSTLARRLAESFPAQLFHMDDFFLQPFQRTPERLLEVGGNVDYERFHREVLKPLAEGQEFSYGIFCCKEQRITEQRKARHAQLTIVEGSYSEHPYFGSPYDLTVCLDISPEVQRERIRRRSGEEMLKRFTEEWIPKENAYLEKFRIMEQCDICIRVEG